MSEQFHVTQENLLSALDSLVARKRPKNEIHIAQLRTKIQSSSSISARYIIEKLFSAGYTLRDILEFFIEAKIVTREEDWLKLRNDVARYVASLLSSRNAPQLLFEEEG